jgi:hypothetical protein
MSPSALVFAKGLAATTVVVSAAATTWVVTAPEGATTAPVVPAAAWIDRPLHGTAVEEGVPLDVVVHASDPDGVARLVLEVDGSEVADLVVDGEPFVEASWTWRPDGPGLHDLVVTGWDPDGEAGTSATTTVRIGGDLPPSDRPSPSPSPVPASQSPRPSPQPSASPSITPSPVTSPSPTPSPTASPSPPAPSSPSPSPGCAPPAPTGDEPYPHGVYLRTFTWTYDGCAADRFEIQVAADEAFETVEHAASVPGAERSWEDPDPYPPCELFHWRVRAVVDGTAGPWSVPVPFDTEPECVR